jgi:hypothetical protein
LWRAAGDCVAVWAGLGSLRAGLKAGFKRPGF